jgi:hypothetical protein
MFRQVVQNTPERLYSPFILAQTAKAQEEAAQRVPDAYRVDEGVVQKQLKDLDTRIASLKARAGEVDKVIESRIKGLKADWEKQVTGLTAERDALTARLVTIQDRILRRPPRSTTCWGRWGARRPPRTPRRCRCSRRSSS